MTKQRLTKDELVELVFQLFWAQAHASGKSSIQSIVIPLDKMREELASRSGTPRQNSKWISTQVRKYEEREGVRLFDRTKDAHGNDALRVTEELLTFVQKRHLYRPEKIRLANGVADFLQSEIASAGDRTAVFLGAGTTVAHLAEILQRRAAESDLLLDVTTHNMGVIEVLTHPNHPDERIRLTVEPGWFDPITYSILPSAPLCAENEFDLVVQGASAVYDGQVYIESERELAYKREVLAGYSGTKLLVLTLHEFFADPPARMHSFGNLHEFDVIVVPRVKRPLENQARGIACLQSSTCGFLPTITGWHYQILIKQPSREPLRRLS